MQEQQKNDDDLLDTLIAVLLACGMVVGVWLYATHTKQPKLTAVSDSVHPTLKATASLDMNSSTPSTANAQFSAIQPKPTIVTIVKQTTTAIIETAPPSPAPTLAQATLMPTALPVPQVEAEPQAPTLPVVDEPIAAVEAAPTTEPSIMPVAPEALTPAEPVTASEAVTPTTVTEPVDAVAATPEPSPLLTPSVTTEAPITTTPPVEPTALPEPSPTLTTPPEAVPQDAATQPAPDAHVVMRESFEFLSGQAAMNAETKLKLQDIAKQLRHEGSPYVIVGHTDNVGSDADNRWLSLRRAKAVKRYLINVGIPAKMLLVSGAGANQPIADNTTPEGRLRNRRIELVE